MRLLLTAERCPKGDIAANLRGHLARQDEGRAAGADLVLLPEMSLTGYRASAAIDLSDAAVETLVAATSVGPALCFGLVERRGTGLAWITQVVALDGELAVVHRKAHLGEDEDTDFAPGPAAEPFELAGVRCSIAVCAEIGVERAYATGVDLVLGPAAPGLYGPRRKDDESWQRGFDWWTGATRDDATRLLRSGQRLAVSTQAGATDDEDFPGWAGLLLAPTADGEPARVRAGLPDWREATLLVEV